ncbi:MAG: TIGR01777 family oxidoreductase [Acidobacteriota bacterium]|nr:TIGR01777 family oxidoreductase [Acidobacteriota bacterium]
MLARHFHANSHQVTVLARNAAKTPWRTVFWNGRDLGPWAKEVDGCDIVLNLAGRNVNTRYNEANRREIKDSRTGTTRLVGAAIAQAARPPRIWINASTATIYRHALDRPMDEATGEIGGTGPGAPSTWRFSIDVATSWERAFFESDTPRTRKIALRSAMTMSPDKNGVFDVLLRLIRFGLGGRAGSGRQFVSWIHENDFIRAVEFLIAREELSGPVNVCSPNPLPNDEFMRVLRCAWGMPIGLPAAKWMLEIGAIFLRTETELILKSRRVVPGRLLEAGFEFRFPDWDAASRDLVRRWRQNH